MTTGTEPWLLVTSVHEQCTSSSTVPRPIGPVDSSKSYYNPELPATSSAGLDSRRLLLSSVYGTENHALFFCLSWV